MGPTTYDINPDGSLTQVDGPASLTMGQRVALWVDRNWEDAGAGKLGLGVQTAHDVARRAGGVVAEGANVVGWATSLFTGTEDNAVSRAMSRVHKDMAVDPEMTSLGDVLENAREGQLGNKAEGWVVFGDRLATAMRHYQAGVAKGAGWLSTWLTWGDNTFNRTMQEAAGRLAPADAPRDSSQVVEMAYGASDILGGLMGSGTPATKAMGLVGKGFSFVGSRVSAVRASGPGRAILAVMPTMTQAGKAAQMAKVEASLAGQGFVATGGSRVLVQPRWYDLFGHTKNLFGFRTYATAMERAGGGGARVSGHLFNVGRDARITPGAFRPHVARTGGPVGAGTQKISLISTEAPGWWRAGRAAVWPVKTATAPLRWVGRHPRASVGLTTAGVGVDVAFNEAEVTKAVGGAVWDYGTGKGGEFIQDQVTENPENVLGALALGVLFSRWFGFLGGLVGAVIGWFAADHIADAINPSPPPPEPRSLGEWASDTWGDTKEWTGRQWERLFGPGEQQEPNDPDLEQQEPNDPDLSTNAPDEATVAEGQEPTLASVFDQAGTPQDPDISLLQQAPEAVALDDLPPAANASELAKTFGRHRGRRGRQRTGATTARQWRGPQDKHEEEEGLTLDIA